MKLLEGKYVYWMKFEVQFTKEYTVCFWNNTYSSVLIWSNCTVVFMTYLFSFILLIQPSSGYSRKFPRSPCPYSMSGQDLCVHQPWISREGKLSAQTRREIACTLSFLQSRSLLVPAKYLSCYLALTQPKRVVSLTSPVSQEDASDVGRYEGIWLSVTPTSSWASGSRSFPFLPFC